MTLGTFDPSTGSASALEKVKHWYSRCMQDHHACKRMLRSKDWRPTRLLGFGLLGASWRLVVPGEDGVDVDKYATLSYCWGQPKSPPLRLLAENISQLRNGTQLDVLPRTYVEAIEVARNLGIEYIWIDALCIIQNSESDWRAESVKMQSIYGNSACNIAASASTNPFEGLFRDRTASDVLPIIRTNWTNHENHCISDFRRLPYIFSNYENLPLLRRGWVVQERILAPRVLHFTEHQIFWECDREPLLCEAFVNGIPGPPSAWSPRPLRSIVRLSYHKRMLDEVLDLWFRVVRSYSRASLTFDKDRLIAVAGVGALFAQTGDDYISGCWRSRFVECLCWQTDDFDDPTSSRSNMLKPQTFRRPTVSAFPTWSWASVVGPVQYIQYLNHTGMVTVLGELSGSQHYSFSARDSDYAPTIAIRGPVLEATCRRRANEGRSAGIRLDQIHDSRNSDCIILDVDENEVHDGDDITILLLCLAPETGEKTYGLVLLPEHLVGETVYRRVGHLGSFSWRITHLIQQQDVSAGASRDIPVEHEQTADAKATFIRRMKEYSRRITIM